MKVEEMEKAQNLAEEHWIWLQKLLHQVAVDFFIHGYKHAKEEKDDRE